MAVDIARLPWNAGFRSGETPPLPKYPFDAKTEYVHAYIQCRRMLDWPEWSEVTLGAVRPLLLLGLGPALVGFPKGDAGQPVASVSSRTIRDIPPQGLLLSEPGVYTMTNDLEWTPSTPNTAAIVIAANNVTLNMNGHTLRKANGAADCVGVFIGNRTQQLANIRVANATIAGFDTHGVCAVGVDGMELQRVRVTDLRGNDTALTFVNIMVVACTDVTVSNCTVADTRVRGNAYSGMQFRFCAGVIVTGVSISTLHNVSGGCSGLTVFGCRDVQCSSTSIRGLSSGEEVAPQPIGQTCLGVFVMLSVHVRLTKVTVDTIQGSSDDAHGVSIFQSLGFCDVEDCTITNVSTGYGSAAKTGAKCTGVEIMFADKCTVRRTRVADVRAIRPQDKQAAGFTTGGTHDAAFEDCTAEGIRCEGDPTSEGVAFGWAAEPRPIFVKPSTRTHYKRCTAKHADVGFDLFYQQYARVEKCDASVDVRVPIRDKPDDVRIVSCNEASECHPAMTVRVRNLGGHNTVTNVKF